MTKKPVTDDARKTAARKTSPARAPKTRKTVATTQGPTAFLAKLEPATRADCERLDAMMSSATGEPGVMYGSAIVGYGTTMIRYADGREAPWMRVGFSPRKNALVIYGVVATAPAALLASLGKYTTGKDCLYVKRLADVRTDVLEKLIARATMAKR